MEDWKPLENGLFPSNLAVSAAPELCDGLKSAKIALVAGCRYPCGSALLSGERWIHGDRTVCLPSLIFMQVIERDEVEHLAHAASDTGAVHGLDLVGGEVGGDVGEHALGNEAVVAG